MVASGHRRPANLTPGTSPPDRKKYSVFDRLVSAAACRSVTAQPNALLSVLNLLDEGILLLDVRCNSLWANTVFASAIRADPECDRILTETRRLAASVAAAEESFSSSSPAPRTRLVARADVCTRVARYALRAMRLAHDVELMERPFDVVVSMARVIRHFPDAEALVKRFGLTPSEAMVALLLARGMSNRDIARTLTVSAHTARHHTENVLLKLGIHTRAAVGGIVFDADLPARPDHVVARPAATHDRIATAPRDGQQCLSDIADDDRWVGMARASSG